MTREEIKMIETEATNRNRQGIAFYYKLWMCLKKALADEKELGCHCNDIVRHLGRSVDSGYTYFDPLMNAWCEYFLGW